MPSDGSVDGVATVNTAITGSGNKRKRVTNDDNEVPKAKRGAKTKKEVKAKVEPKEGANIEDVGGNGETTDVKEEIDKVHEGAHEDLDEGDDTDV
jgi:hypothetical protein